jgi:neutral ceramidase
MKSKMMILITAILVAIFISYGQHSIAQGTLRAGFSKIDITPSIPVELYGYASRKTLSTGVHDTLFARVIVFENSGNKFVMISSDIGSYDFDLFETIKKELMDRFKLRDSELILSTIHSHSSPVVSLTSDRLNENNIRYTNELVRKLTAAVGEAFAAMKPVTIAANAGSSPVGSNRREMRSDGQIKLGRNPYGPTDKEVLVMKVAAIDGSFTGALFDYATHSTSLGPDNMLISGDVLGISAQFVEKILGRNMITPVFAGASGDIDPWYRILPGFNEEPGWIPETVLLGTLLGEEVVHVFRGIKETKPGGEISSLTYTLACNRRKLDDPANNSRDQNQIGSVPVNITVAKAGDDVAFVGFSVEMLTEIGMSIKKASPFKYTFIITHCNGDSGYLPPAHLYKEGGYEVTSSEFEIGSAEKVVKQALTMLYDLK